MSLDSIPQLLHQLTLEEKVSLLSGADVWQTQEISRLGIGSIKTSDGPSGARGKFAVDGPSSAFVPGPVCQAATWSASEIRDLGRLLCREAKQKAAQVLLAPTICCARNPLGGRNFECFGEDPFLSGTLASEYVLGVQETGEVSATPKHFVGNEQEHQRFSVDAQISERALREIYLRPFEMVLQSAFPGCIMTAYNSVNGKHMDMNSSLIKNVLREDWGFKGVIMSDWGGTNSTIDSLRAGLDLEMPGPPERRGTKLIKAIEEEPNGEILHQIDKSVTRILNLADKFGLLGLTPEDASKSRDREETSHTSAKDVQLMRQIAANGIVLLKNSSSTLPLDLHALAGKQVAFVGPNALVGAPGGGGSASMNPQYLSQPMESFKQAAAQMGVDLHVQYSPGAYARKWLALFDRQQWKNPSMNANQPMLRIDFFESTDMSGPVIETQHRGNSTVDLSDSSPHQFQTENPPPYSLRISSLLTPTATGTHCFSLSSVGGSRIYIDGELVVDNGKWTERGETFYSFGSVERIGSKHMEAGREYSVTIDAWMDKDLATAGGILDDANHVFSSHPSLRIGYQEEMADPETMISEAVSLANESEITVAVLGLSDEWESEGYDRQSMALPGDQDKLVRALLDRMRRPESLVIVNQSGSPVEVPWIDSASTFLQAWYGGQEAGNALADVLLGRVNPSGRLPITWPRKYGDLPFASDAKSWPGEDGTVFYKEDTHVGYRWYLHNKAVKPQWWFGYGLSFTKFECHIYDVTDEGDHWTVDVRVDNLGNLAGHEVVQVYLWPRGHHEEAVLCGAQKTALLQPKAIIMVSLDVRKKDLATWKAAQWVLARGVYVIGVGTGPEDAINSPSAVDQKTTMTWMPNGSLST